MDPNDGLHLGLLAFNDYSGEDNVAHEKVTNSFGGFTSNVNTVVKNLESLVASGGGDQAEAVTTALDQALRFEWRRNAVKVAVLITDAPPHGIEESHMIDHYREGEPGGKLAL